MPTRTKAILDKVQELWWSDLDLALHSAANGHWSIATESLVQRIVWLASSEGITDWGKVPIPLLTSGVYNAIGARLGLPPTKFTFREGMQPDLLEFPEKWSRLTVYKIRDMELEPFENPEDW